MKTKEFMAKVRSLEFGIIQEGHQLVIRTPGCSVVARVNIFSQQTEIFYFTFGSADRRELLKIISEYTGTPPEEREEEKKYQFKLSLPIGIESGIYGWLNQNTDTGEFKLSSRENTAEMKTIFTELEASQMDITGFQKVEVSND